MNKNIKQSDINKMNEAEAKSLLKEIKDHALYATLEDTRSCREFVEYIKEIFIDECPEDKE